MKMKIINQKFITDFVTAVETKKEFLPVPDKIFRHIVSEMGELDNAIFRIERMEKNKKLYSHFKRAHKFFTRNIGEELLDILFLVCYMAKVYGVDLNELAPKRIGKIKKQYGVIFPLKKKRRK